MPELERLPRVMPKGGRPPARPGRFADPGPRALELLEKFGMDKIVQFYEDGIAKKKVPLSSGDMLLVGRLARAFRDGTELEHLHNRSYGKVPDKNINLNVNVEADPEKLSERAAEMLARLQD